jgi:hypothetical protein
VRRVLVLALCCLDWAKDPRARACRNVPRKGGLEAAEEAFGPNAERLSKWKALKLGIQVTPKASRVAGFIITWALAMADEDRDEFSITEYQRYWNEGERQAYRLQAEFRELWQEFETPNELARQVVGHLGSWQGDGQALPLTVPVVA